MSHDRKYPYWNSMAETHLPWTSFSAPYNWERTPNSKLLHEEWKVWNRYLALQLSRLPPEGQVPKSTRSDSQQVLHSWFPQDYTKQRSSCWRIQEHSVLYTWAQCAGSRQKHPSPTFSLDVCELSCQRAQFLISLHLGADCSSLLSDAERSWHTFKCWKPLRTKTIAWVITMVW